MHNKKVVRDFINIFYGRFFEDFEDKKSFLHNHFFEDLSNVNLIGKQDNLAKFTLKNEPDLLFNVVYDTPSTYYYFKNNKYGEKESFRAKDIYLTDVKTGELLPLFSEKLKNKKDLLEYFVKHRDICECFMRSYPEDCAISSLRLSDSDITFEFVDSYGGEGQGSDYWSVYKFTLKNGENFLLKFDGWYQSYEGSEYEDFYEVEPEEKFIVVYKPTNKES